MLSLILSRCDKHDNTNYTKKILCLLKKIKFNSISELGQVWPHGQSRELENEIKKGGDRVGNRIGRVGICQS